MDTITDTKKSRLIMITGGQRSGKSVFAEKLALSMSERPIYLATAQVFDEEMRYRVDIHKKRRHDRWINIESPFYLKEEDYVDSDVILLDCLTLLATNWFLKLNESVENALEMIKMQIEILCKTGATVIIVTNEVGLGGVSANEMQRKFADLQGYLNQYVAEKAEDVYLIVAGIPVKIK